MTSDQTSRGRIGYARVSTGDQNPDSQRDALAAAGCERVFTDKVSGKLARRPQWDACLAYLREGDTLVITRLSRVARSLRTLLEIADQLRERGIGLVVLKQDIDTTTPAGRLVFHLFGALDEFQRELIVEGTHEGLAAARARGRTGGRKPKMSPDQIELAGQLADAREHTMQQIADMFGVTKPTLYRNLKPAGRTPVPTTITDKTMRSTDTAHTAEAVDGGWAVTWLPGRVLTRNQAVTAMQLAAAVGRGVGLHDDPIWPHLEGWAQELGLSGPRAVTLICDPGE